MMSVASIFTANPNLASIPVFPLTARSLNLPPSRLFRFGGMSESKRVVEPPSAPVTLPGSMNAQPRILRSHRPSANPLHKTQEQARSERRDRYLNRVRQQREESRWNVRGDQILQRDYLTEQRAWEAEQARAAPAIDLDFDDDISDERDPQTQHSSSVAQLDSQLPWYQAPSQASEHMDLSNSQPLLFSQPSQARYQHYRPTGGHAESPRLTSSREQSEIDEILAAEERELEALVALHYGETSPPRNETGPRSYDDYEDMWNELPDIRHDDRQGHLGDVAAANAASSPTWSSDDAEFEAELLRLGVDAMDVSRG